MIKTEIDKTTYWYGIDDCQINDKYTGRKLTACFDPENMDKVHLFNGAKHLGTFNRITPAQQYGSTDQQDMRAVGILKKIAKDMSDYRNNKRTAIGSPPDDDTPCEPAALIESNEVNMLLAGKIDKFSYEQAETAFLLENSEEQSVDGDEIDTTPWQRRY
jgi:hypothetical protein